jgi:hypothetical protein
MNKLTKIFCAVLLVVAVTSTVIVAHHASAGIDRSKTVSVTGIVKQFKWANPHSWLEMEVVRDGKTELWNFEMLPPSYLVPAGWTRNTVKVGDKVTVTGNGFTDGRPGGIFVSVTLPNGQTVGQRGGGGGGRGAGGGAPGGAPQGGAPRGQ